MINADIITQIGRQIADAIPESAKATQQEIEKNIRAVLQSAISKLDLVSRDEFDAQVEVLKRTRSKLDQMELTISALEQKVNKPSAAKRSTRSRPKGSATIRSAKPKPAGGTGEAPKTRKRSTKGDTKK